MRYDVAIVGGGPAGLACGIEAALRGLSAVIIEKHSMPCDKACGEGIMPAGVRALDALGVLSSIPASERAAIRGVRYIESDGSSAQGLLPGEGGLGIRRTSLAAAMLDRARELGVEIRDRCEARGSAITAHSRSLETSSGSVEAGLLVAADGLASRLRRAEGLDIAASGPRRFGARRHYFAASADPFVEVHFAGGAEAYVTPIGNDRIGVALLWDRDRLGGSASFDELLSLFPALLARVRGAAVASTVRGAGPLRREAKRRAADRFVLLGDAAGYVDAITGEGLSLALQCAAALGEILPSALAQGATALSLAPYEEACARAFRRYAWLTESVLALSRKEALRRRVLGLFRRSPGVFERVLAAAVG